MNDQQDTEAMDAARFYDLSRRVQGQRALVWWAKRSSPRGGYGLVLAVSGDLALAVEDDLADHLEWNNERPPADGLWLWEGWGYWTAGGPEHPHEADLVLGGEWRRLADLEALALARGVLFTDSIANQERLRGLW